MLVQEVVTDLPPREVIARAKEFFLTRFSAYGGFVQDESEAHVRFEVEAGEVVLGAMEREGDSTLVRISTSRLHHESSQFLMTLANPERVKQSLVGPGTSGAG